MRAENGNSRHGGHAQRQEFDTNYEGVDYAANVSTRIRQMDRGDTTEGVKIQEKRGLPLSPTARLHLPRFRSSKSSICHIDPLQIVETTRPSGESGLNCYMRRYRLIPENASIPATINVIGNHILTSAILKNTKETMIKITPTATVKIPNCLGMNHPRRKDERTVRL
jgi:hypothetical protein